MGNISFFQSYGFVMLDNIGGFFTGSSFFLVLAMIIALLVKFITYDDIGDDTHKQINKALKFMLPLFVVAAFLANIVPTTKQAAAIIAIPVIANSDEVRSIPDNVMKVGNAWLQELTPDNAKEVAAAVKDGAIEVADAAKEVVTELKK